MLEVPEKCCICCLPLNSTGKTVDVVKICKDGCIEVYANGDFITSIRIRIKDNLIAWINYNNSIDIFGDIRYSYSNIGVFDISSKDVLIKQINTILAFQ